MEKRNKIVTDEQITDLLLKSVPDSFSSNFTEKVIRRIKSVESRTNEFDFFVEVLTRQFKRFAIIGAMVIALLITYNVFSNGEVTLAKAFDVPDYTLEDAYDPINSLRWSKE